MSILPNSPVREIRRELEPLSSLQRAIEEFKMGIRPEKEEQKAILARLGKAGKENPFERIDLRFELDTLDGELESLRISYEQFFTGLKTIEGRYNTLHSYWQRVLRERDDGTYCKDVFKANMRERCKLEDARAQTAQGAAENAIKQLFTKYKETLENHTGKAQNIDFAAFQKAIVQRTREFKAQNNGRTKKDKIPWQSESK
jgi:hypothetical protein